MKTTGQFQQLYLLRKILVLLLVYLGIVTKMNAQIYNVSYNQINIGGSGVTIIPKVGTGTSVNDIVLYQNVITVSGQAMDAVVTTTQLSNCTFSTYDQTNTTGANTGNSANYFSPQFTIGSGGGYAMFSIQFILGGSYNNSLNTGTNVTLSNVNLNTFDLDGNGSAGTNQYAEFGGFSSSELGSPTNVTTTYNSATGLTKFRSNVSTNTNDITDVRNRVRVTYDYLSLFSTKVGADGSGAAYFFLDFSTGATFTTAVSYAAPVLDLNTVTNGLDNSAVIVAPNTAMFTYGGANITYSGSTLDNLKLSYSTSQIQDGASEELVFFGASSGGPIPLNFTNGQVFGNIQIGAVSYAVTATVSGGTSTLTFVRSGGAPMTLAQDEALLDAFQYSNSSTHATVATRVFVVTTLAGVYETAPAKFYVTITSSLPTEMSSFYAKDNQGSVELIWKMASEFNVDLYKVQSSPDGKNWEDILIVNSKGNSNQEQLYEANDISLKRGLVYYRIASVDIDGNNTIYNPITWQGTSQKNELLAFPNPASSDVTLSVISEDSFSDVLTLVNSSGQIVQVIDWNIERGSNSLLLNVSNFNDGIYYLQSKLNEDAKAILVKH